MSANSPGIIIARDLPVPWVRMADGLIIVNPAALEKVKTETKG